MLIPMDCRWTWSPKPWDGIKTIVSLPYLGLPVVELCQLAVHFKYGIILGQWQEDKKKGTRVNMYKATPAWKTFSTFEASTFPGCEDVCGAPRWKCRWFWASWSLADQKGCGMYTFPVALWKIQWPCWITSTVQVHYPKDSFKVWCLVLVASNYTPNLISVGMICIDLPQMCWQARKSVIKSQRLWYTKQIRHRKYVFLRYFQVFTHISQTLSVASRFTCMII